MLNSDTCCLLPSGLMLRERESEVRTLGAKARRWAKIFVFATAAVAIAVAVALDKIDMANGLAGIASLFLTLLGLVVNPQQKTVTPADLRERLRTEMKSVLHRDAQLRGLLRPELLPVRLLDRNGRDARRDSGGPVWAAGEFQRHAAGLVTGATPGRMIIYGPPSSGKSTLALMMALGLLSEGYVPLLLDGSSWDPVRDSFADWFDKEVSSVLGPGYEHKGNLYDVLGHEATTVVIIDDFDALAAHAKEAVGQLERSALHTRPLILFARSGTIDPSILPAGYTVRTLAPPKPGLLHKHLRQLVGKPAADGRWRPVLDRINRRQDDDLTALLSTPLFLGLARQVCDDPGSGRDPGRLVTLVDEHGRTSAEEFLLNEQVAMATSTALNPGLRLRLDTPGARRWLRNLAAVLRGRKDRRMAWWEVHTAIPPAVPMFATALVLLPAYQLALVMPLGLTRGLAIGLAAGVVMGLLRGVTPDARSVVIAGLTATAGVWGIGLFHLSPAQAAGDAVELGTAFTLALACRPLLIRRHPLRLPLPRGRGLGVPGRVVGTAAVALVACGSALACEVAGRLGAEFKYGGGFPPIFVSMATGVGIATMAGRMMAVDLSAPPVPCRLAPRIRGILRSPLPYLLKAIPPVVLIGVMAGLTGIWRGAAYGTQIVIVFGLVLGVPIALVVGTINWLAQSLPSEPAASARTIRRGDRWAALGCVAAVALVATAGIMVLRGPGDSLIKVVEGQSGGFSVQPWQGILFGLTLGVVLASLHTVWPAVVVGQLWLAGSRKLPWRTVLFLEELHTRRLLRRTGPYYQFTHDRLADVLDTGERASSE
ncbi:hypothetical protein GCM10009734_20410 [Nonomuraea bangladeshensis]